MEKADVLNKITCYVAQAQLWHKLRLTHTDDELNDLLLQIILIEEELLAFYGLPNTLHYNEYFQLLALKDDFILADAKQLISELEESAATFLSSPVITDVELLRQAFENKTTIENVLPATRLKLKPEPYFDYVYETKFLKGLTEPQVILTDFQIVAENGLGQKLTDLSLNQDLCSDDYESLHTFNLQFTEDFILNYQDYKNRIMVQ
jgi:hypothetical protein